MSSVLPNIQSERIDVVESDIDTPVAAPKAPRGRLFRTSAFRIAVIYATLFSALSAATLGFIYWSTRDQIESQVDARLRLETDYLINLYKSGALPELLEAIQRRNQIDTYGRFYYLANNETTSTSEEDTDESAARPYICVGAGRYITHTVFLIDWRCVDRHERVTTHRFREPHRD